MTKRSELKKTGIKNIFLDNFSNKFSNWKRLVNVIKRIKEMVKNFRNRRKKHDPNDATEQVTPKKLRGKTEFQKMADLPSERLVPAPPFVNVGIDAFGPWNVVTRKTRGGSANSKRWAILFTCLGTRAVHIEVVEEDMSTSSFINALRRFIAIRGNVKELRSDRGTNFVGAAHIFKDMNKMQVVNVEDEPMKEFLKNSDLVWKFNPPHSSHMGGVWERMIGMARKILDAMLMTDNLTSRNLTHEVLVTLMAEVSAIMNSRPVAGISTDPEAPHIMSPATLLTQKTSSEAMYDCADLDTKDMYREQWKRVKLLSEMFLRRWKDGYLQSLQTRRKWNQVTRDIKEGDVILLKDKNYSRMEWPVGIVVNAIKSDSDGRVRKAEREEMMPDSILERKQYVAVLVFALEHFENGM
ncbi:uncharacterized protein [Argopecten irradians]|uniref:uncharacterized protein n=1 Tax=Argopecten irradians TaxID=31199 RepID=UPI00371DC541